MRKPDRPKASQIFRCAIYTRKSSEDGLEQVFNSASTETENTWQYEGGLWLTEPNRLLSALIFVQFSFRWN
jgi:hypothetical protein